MSEQIKMTMMSAVLLDEMVNTLLYKVEDGKKVDRDIPFRLKYRLQRNESLLAKYYKKFAEFKYLAYAKYGKYNEETNDVDLDDKAKEDVKKCVEEYLKKEVEVSVMRLDPEDFDSVVDKDVNFTTEALRVLQGYLVEDDEFFDEMADNTLGLELEKFANEEIDDGNK